jgi:RNA-directed DNA polymerase
VRRAGSAVELWSAEDALVLKAVAIVLGDAVRDQVPGCHHLAGNGGVGGALRAVAEAVRPGAFVLRSDVKQDEASMDHERLMAEVDEMVADRGLRALIWSALRRSTVDGGVYRDVTRGISLGSALSPLLGALYLRPLDAAMRELGVFYARFMDDWVVLAPSPVEAARSVARDERGAGRAEGGEAPGQDVPGAGGEEVRFSGVCFFREWCGRERGEVGGEVRRACAPAL